MVVIEGDTGEILRMTSVEVNFCKTVGMVLSLGGILSRRNDIFDQFPITDHSVTSSIK